MGDLFCEQNSNEDIAAVFGVMAVCPQHTFQVLTKRPERMLEWFNWTVAHSMNGVTSTIDMVAQQHAFDRLCKHFPLHRYIRENSISPFPLPIVLPVLARKSDNLVTAGLKSEQVLFAMEFETSGGYRHRRAGRRAAGTRA
jgi:hypothetical protein